MFADTIIETEALFTGVGADAVPGAVAVAGDRIVFAGSKADAEGWRGPETIVKDYGDALVIPGFHDSHLHFFHSALYSSPLAMNYLGSSEADYVARLAPLAASRPEGSWVLAQGWREYRWNPAAMPSRRSLDIFDEARQRYGPLEHGQNCLEHLENFQPDDIARLAELDVLAAVQPPHITLDPGGPERDLGLERIRWMWPFATFLEQGVKMGFGTDSPVVDVNSMDVLYTAVTRQDPRTHEPLGGWLPAERITMAEAIRAYTLGSAQAAGRAHELGTIEAGKFADIAVLDRNLLTVPEDEIQGARVLATYVGGACRFEV